MEKEIWKDIEGYEDLYQVSSYGRVMIKDRLVCSEKQNRSYVKKGRLMKLEVDKDGYHVATLNRGLPTRKQRFRVHRLVAAAFIPMIEGKNIVDHINEIKNDNRVENLRWCTIQENTQWSFDNGRTVLVGQSHGSSKLTEVEVIEIKKLLRGKKMKQSDIARKFSVSPSRITEIKNGRSWGHIE